jgi:hypothetical protein
MARIPVLSPLVPKGDGRTVKPEPKRADPFCVSPVLYEFPLQLQKDESYWRDQRNWPLLLPNLGRSIDPQRLADDYRNNGKVNKEAIWVSQHLNNRDRHRAEDGCLGGRGILGGQTIALDHLLEVCRDEPTADTKLRPQVWEYS